MSKNKYDSDTDDEEHNIVFSIDNDSEDEIQEEKKKQEKKIQGKGLSWKQFMAKNFSGKTFNSKQEANEYMKELARKYKEQK